jgi:hypothetical protein
MEKFECYKHQNFAEMPILNDKIRLEEETNKLTIQD